MRCCGHCHAIYRSDFLRCPTDGHELAPCNEDPIVGTTIAEHYVIDACVGEGAMGRVYRAHHSRLARRRFAVKILLGDFASTLAMRMRFAQEAEAASQLDHANVVPVLDFGKSAEGLLFLAMEYVDGRTLSTIIHEEAPLAPARVVRIAAQLCLGLEHAHEHGLVHRDFKPDNVIVVDTERGEVPRILDFGLAIAADTEGQARLTSAGMSVGTPAYAAPEQVSTGVVDGRADLFALGVTLYEMLTGKIPFDGNMLEVMHLNATIDPPAMAERAPGASVPPALEKLVRKLMARDRDARFASARDVIDALKRLEWQASSPAMVVEAAPAIVRKRRRGAIAALAVVTAAVVAATGVVAWERFGGDDAKTVATTKTPAPAPAPPRPPVHAEAPVVAIAPKSDVVTAAAPVVKHDAPPTRKTPHHAAAPKHAPASARVATAVTQEDVAPHETGSATIGSAAPPIVVAPPVAPHVEPVHTEPAKDAHASVGGLSVEGALSELTVRRAIDRVAGGFRTCFLEARATRSVDVPARFVIDESRRATAIHVDGPMAACLSDALRAVRTETPPDVGTVKVAFTIHMVAVP